MRVFIAGPYTAKTPEEIRENVERAMIAGLSIMEFGHQPFVPHLSHWLDLCATGGGECISYARWLEWSLSWGGCCDALICIGTSPGAGREVAEAVAAGIPVFESVAEFLA